MRFLLVDNFDSFTYNIVHYLEKSNVEVVVRTNESVDLNEIPSFDAVVLSPGPGLPKDAGLLMKVIDVATKIGLPIFGICLGMQALAQWEGSELYNQQQVKHGVAEWINISSKNSRLYTGIADKIEVGLYHSWAIQLKFQSEFIPTAYSDNNVLMSFEDPEKLIFGVQYHPESILTPNGIQIIQNFIKIVQDSLLD